jgi:hypothetical protein
MKPELLKACNRATSQVDSASSDVFSVIKHSLLTQTLVSHPSVVSVSWVLQTGVAFDLSSVHASRVFCLIV